MNTKQAAELIRDAALVMEATVYSPEEWGDRNSDAYALTLADTPAVIMVRTEDVIDGLEVTAYAYRTETVPTTADDIMAALMTEDGSSIDPAAEGNARVGVHGEATAEDVHDAVVDAFGALDETEEG